MLTPRAPARSVRLQVLRGLIAVAFLAMVVQLWRLQMVQGSEYQEAADVNRFRLELDPAPRGVIYDRRGNLLARNMPQLSVAIVPAYLPEDAAERRALLAKLDGLLDVPLTTSLPGSEPDERLSAEQKAGTAPVAGILEILEEAEPAPYQPVTIASGVPRDVALKLEEEHLDWPGVLVQVEAAREYLYGSLIAHVLGYVGPIPADEAEEYEARGYDPAVDKVGQTGVEYSFEKELRGQDGHKLIEVDVGGREVRTVGEPGAAVPGNNLRLTLDLDLQRETEEIVRRHLEAVGTRQAAVIAANPQTGEILAMVSLPSYDNNLFTGGISTEALTALQKDPAHPLVNQAISAVVAPGSTFKIIVASGGLEEAVITTDTRLHCGGILWLPNRFYPEDPSLAQPFYCWIHDSYGQHGSLGVVSALGQSCDIFFYQVGGGYRSYFEGLGEERMGYYARLFGLGARTGIDLPGEAKGLVPDSRWKRLNYSESWTTGDTYNMAIGQGFVLATPLQMLVATTAIANGGTLYRPQVVHDVIDGEGKVVRAFAPDVIRTVPVSAENLATVRQGMRAAVSGPGATAWALTVPRVAVAGKTGTAEYFVDANKDGVPDRDDKGHLPTHAWFVAFAPYDRPEIALVVFAYGGGEGSGTAVPIAGDILTYYFGRDAAGSGE